MKHLRETFTEEEWQFLQKTKERNGKNWHDFILLLTQIDDVEWLLGRLAFKKEKVKTR
jgi:hypothetical protein